MTDKAYLVEILHHKDKVCLLCIFDNITADVQWPLLLTWFNFNPSMDK